MATSFETFFNAVVDAGLYSAAEVQEFLRPLPANRQPRDGVQLGRELVRQNMLTHPNIVIAYDAGEACGQCFLVMEYVDGVNLGAHIEQHGPLPLGSACRMIVQAAQGLGAAHQHGIVHRDVKPHNLLLTRSGTVKILDMGLALWTDVGAHKSDLTGAGQIIGTVDYMAPEQARNTRHADQRADIYGLGATFWYLLTGQTMYSGQTVVERLLAHQTQPIPSLADFCPDIPEELQVVFAAMVAKRPEDRYATMQQVIAALEPYKESDTPEAASLVCGDDVGRHDAPCSGPTAADAFDAAVPSTWRTVMQTRSEAVANGSSPSGTDCAADSGAQTTMAVTVDIPASGESHKSRPATSRRTRRNLAVAGGLAMVLLLSVVLVKIWTAKDLGAVPNPEWTEVDLLPLVTPSALGDGQLRDVVAHNDSLVLDATGDSPQLWLNFPELVAEEMTIRTQLRVADGLNDGFVKLICKHAAPSPNSEIYAILIQEAGQRRLLIEVSQPFAQLASCSVGEHVGNDFIDLALEIRRETVCVRLDGTQVLEAAPPKWTKEWFVAIAVVGWRTELRDPGVSLRR